MANSFAYIAIAGWPVFMLFLFKRFSVEKAILISIIGSYLFLPASFEINFPSLPALNKATVTTLTLLFILFFRKSGLGFKSLDKKSMFLLFLFMLSPFITAMLNTSRYLHLPGVTLYDGLTQSINSFLVFLPFLVGAKYFSTFESQKLLFKYLIIACLVYLPLMFFEVRMSPQLHRMVYGFFPHTFVQQVRFDGFRPVVFLGHGLLVAMFVAVCLMALSTSIKAKVKLINFENKLIFLALFAALVLAKTYSALILYIFAGLVLFLFKARLIAMISLCVIVMYLAYPLLSANKIFPHEAIVNTVSLLSPDRAQSLEFRFFHETQLLAHANEKPFFGWSSWGRNRVYDPETFQDLSVTDGRWIITLGTRGWFGFITEFYFIFISMWYAIKISKKSNSFPREQMVFLSGHLLIVTMILIDQIPNASLSYFYWFLIGGLFGVSRNYHNSKKV